MKRRSWGRTILLILCVILAAELAVLVTVKLHKPPAEEPVPSSETTEAETNGGKASIVLDADWLEDHSFRLSAHRGATNFAPENTLEAVREAIDHGYRCVEIDPRLSADGTIYLMHDDTVSRTTDGSGSIEAMTDKEIDALVVDSANYSKYTNDTMRVPRFADAVSILSDTDVILNVDCSKGSWLNADYTDEVIRILRAHNMYDRCFFVATDDEVRAFLNEHYPDLCLSWLYNPEEPIAAAIERVQSYDRAMISIKNEYATDDRLQALLDSGIYFQIYDVNDLKRLAELCDLGVPMVEINDLAVILLPH